MRAVGKKKGDVSNSLIAAARSSVEIEIARACGGYQEWVIRFQNNRVVGNRHYKRRNELGWEKVSQFARTQAVYVEVIAKFQCRVVVEK